MDPTWSIRSFCRGPLATTRIGRREFLAGVATLVTKHVHGQSLRPTLGFLGTTSASSFQRLLAAFHQGLTQGGFDEGRNLSVVYRWADDDPGRLPGMAAELVSMGVSAIAATGGPVSVAAAQKATSKIPIIFTGVTEPIKSGFVASLSRPGANITGVAGLTGELDAKRLELLRELVPSARIIAIIMNPNRPDADLREAMVREAASSIGQPVDIMNGGSDLEIEASVQRAAQTGFKAILFSADPSFNSKRHIIVDVLKKYRIPAMLGLREMTEAGGLVSYGTSMVDIYREAGRYTARVLHGEAPSQLPVVLPSKFELVLNRRAAEELKLHIPETILAQTDDVIE